jgi:hypothetical protein
MAVSGSAETIKEVLPTGDDMACPSPTAKRDRVQTDQKAREKVKRAAKKCSILKNLPQKHVLAGDFYFARLCFKITSMIDRDFFGLSPRLLLLAGLLLSACQSPSGPRMAVGGLSAPIGIEAIDGVPPALQTSLRDGLARGASQHGVKLTDHPEEAKLHLHGYMRADRSNNEFEGILVFDVFDADQNRLQRLTSSIKRNKSSGLSVESLMTPAEIAQLGETAMADLAAYLAH